MTRKLTTITFLSFCFLTTYGQTEKINYWENIPEPTGWVNDFENIFTDGQEKSLDSLISEYEKKTTIEIAIITIPETATNKKRFDNLTLHIANTWGIGKKEKNNGILIGISKGYRKIRIQNGFGIEKLITNNQTKKIIDQTFIPNFKKGEFYKGVFDGIQNIIKILDIKFSIKLNLSPQDTIVYKGILAKDFLIETIELYPDSTFKWTNEYDLTWSEYGKYNVENKILTLKYYISMYYPKTMSLKDSISYIKKPIEIRRFEIENDRIYPLSDKGKRITKKKNSYFKKKWGWLFGNRFKYKITRIE